MKDPDEEVDQRGLFSAAFASRRRFYVRTWTAPGASGSTRSRTAAGRLLLDLGQATTQHHGGQLQLHGGFLLRLDGDGRRPGDEPGPVLEGREDPPGRSGDRRLDRYAMGLRNPWRFSFAGRWMLIGDVGDAHTEEVDVAAGPGANFGWPGYEGRRARRRRPSRAPSHRPSRTPTAAGARHHRRLRRARALLVRRPLPGRIWSAASAAAASAAPGALGS